MGDRTSRELYRYLRQKDKARRTRPMRWLLLVLFLLVLFLLLFRTRVLIVL